MSAADTRPVAARPLPIPARALEALRSSSPGLIVLAFAVGVSAGGGAVAFRYLIFAFTWIFTGSFNFGQQGRVLSPHFPGLGAWFIVLAPILAGLVFGPIIAFFAREARGHGVPEVMIAVAENGGRIRPQVTMVKAIASALCIGGGGSVGREGPIVQIGSALASSLGQLIRMSEARLRIIVACGAAAGISATFNAPLAGVFFGLELILREVSVEAFIAVLAASMAADVVGQAAFGRQPFFAGLPIVHFPTPADYLLCALLGLLGAGAGLAFKTFLYRMEDLWDRLWRGRPEWLRPAVGGLPLGLLLLAVPQLYGVGYPVLQLAIGGGYVLWFLVALLVGKIVAASLTIAIGGSGGVFAPSLFIGAMLGVAFGTIANHVFGPAAGPIAAYGMVGMAAVFAGAARAPLTSTAAVLEMTGDFGIVLPIMLATALAAALSRRISYGTIYTTKLLRRGTDVDRPRPSTLFQVLKAADAMASLPRTLSRPASLEQVVARLAPRSQADREVQPAEVPHFVFADETLQQALRQLVLYGHRGLPVLDRDGTTVVGWLTNRDVMRAFAKRLGQSIAETDQGARAARFAIEDEGAARESPTPLAGYRVVEVEVPEWSGPPPRLREVDWPPNTLVVAVSRSGGSFTPRGETELRPRDRLSVLAPADQSQAVREAMMSRAQPCRQSPPPEPVEAAGVIDPGAPGRSGAPGPAAKPSSRESETGHEASQALPAPPGVGAQGTPSPPGQIADAPSQPEGERDPGAQNPRRQGQVDSDAAPGAEPPGAPQVDDRGNRERSR